MLKRYQLEQVTAAIGFRQLSNFLEIHHYGNRLYTEQLRKRIIYICVYIYAVLVLLGY